MFYTFREPNLITFRVNFPQIASIFTFSVYIFFTFSCLFTRIEGNGPTCTCMATDIASHPQPPKKVGDICYFGDW